MHGKRHVEGGKERRDIFVGFKNKYYENGDCSLVAQTSAWMMRYYF